MRLPIRPMPASGQPPFWVTAPSGHYRGERELGALAFKGIYYATAQRFASPTAVCDRQADGYGPRAPQDSLPAERYSEDCLHLNIFTPLSLQELRPVLFFIHGGSFMRGSNRSRILFGHRIARELEAIVVTINYRLGLFGFLDFSPFDSAFSPNPGYEDVRLALRFVLRNIASFGGDPENITVMGESAGGSLAALLAIDEEVDFTRLILQSAFPATYLNDVESKERSRHFLSFLKLSSPQDLLQLETAELGPLSNRYTKTTSWGVASFAPAIDGRLVRHFPLPALVQGRGHKRPVWVGMTGHEMSVLGFRPTARRWRIEAFIEKGLALEEADFAQRLRELYDRLYEEEERTIQFYSDVIVRQSLVWYAELSSRHQPTWLYRFDHADLLSRTIGLKAFHGSDLVYFFGNLPTPLRTPANNAVVERVQADLRLFLETGHLPWSPVQGMPPLARIYGEEISLGKIMPDEVLALWNTSNYRKRSLGLNQKEEVGFP